MSEVVRRDTGEIVPAHTVGTLVQWAQDADAAYTLAQRLVATSFCPAQFRGKPEEAAAAMLAGSEVGLSPMASLRAFDVIQGTAAPRAMTLRAVAQSRGCQFTTIAESETRVRMRARRPGGEWEEVEWTIDRANRLGLTGKDNWRKQPQAMLVARATADLARRVAADALLGIPYAAEEIEDSEPAPTTTLSRAAVAAKRTVKRETPPTPEPDLEETSNPTPTPSAPTSGPPTAPSSTAPAEDGEATGSAPNAAPISTTSPDGITAAQSRMMFALLREASMSDRELALAFMEDVLGRPVESSKTLTKVEAGQIIDRLTEMTAPTAATGDEPVFDAEVVE